MAYKSSFSTPKTTATEKQPAVKGQGYVSSFSAPKPKKVVAPLPDPSTIQTVSGNFMPPVQAMKSSTMPISFEGDSPIDSIVKGAQAVIKNPRVATAAATKAAIIDFPMKVFQGIQSAGGFKMNAENLRANREAINMIFDSNLKDKSEEEAASAGNFIGEQIPYILGAEVLAPIAAAGALKRVGQVASYGRTGSKITLDSISRINTISRLAGEAAGFVGTSQLEHLPEDGSRLERIKNDLIMFAIFEGLAGGARGIKDLRAKGKVQEFIDRVNIEKPPLATLEKEASALKTIIKKEAGKSPEALIGDVVKSGDEVAINGAIDALQTRKAQRGIPTAITEEVVTPVGETKYVSSFKEAPAPMQAIEGTGETKTRGLSKGVEEKAIENKLTKGFSELPEYEAVNMKDQAKKASDILTSDKDFATRVALGIEPPPKGVIPEAVFTAVENEAIRTGDIATLRKLATQSSLTTEATTMGQRIRTLAERDPESPIGAIMEVVKAREKKALKLTKQDTVSKSKKAIVKQVRDEIKKVKVTPKSWGEFVESIKC